MVVVVKCFVWQWLMCVLSLVFTCVGIIDGIGVTTVFFQSDNQKMELESESEVWRNGSQKNWNCSTFFRLCSVSVAYDKWKLKHQKQKQTANHSTLFLTTSQGFRFILRIPILLQKIWFSFQFFFRLCYDSDSNSASVSDVSENQPLHIALTFSA